MNEIRRVPGSGGINQDIAVNERLLIARIDHRLVGAAFGIDQIQQMGPPFEPVVLHNQPGRPILEIAPSGTWQ